MLTRIREVGWQSAAAAVAGVLITAILAGQIYAWIERRRIDWTGGAR